MENKTILLVDDEEDIRALFTLVLESAGWTVIAVAQASAALEILATRPVDLLVTDYQMPEMNGAELITLVRVRFPHIRTVLASGQSQVHVFATSCGAHTYYRKGTPLSHLLTAVTDLAMDGVPG